MRTPLSQNFKQDMLSANINLLLRNNDRAMPICSEMLKKCLSTFAARIECGARDPSSLRSSTSF